jgi:PKD repeat protein
MFKMTKMTGPLGSVCATAAVALGLLLGATTAQSATVEKDGDVCTAIRDLPIGSKLWDVEFTDNISMAENYDEFDVSNSTDAETVVETVAAALRAEGDCARVGLTSDSKDSSTVYRVPFEFVEDNNNLVRVAAATGDGQGGWADTESFPAFDYMDASVSPRIMEASGLGRPKGNQAPVADAGAPVDAAVGQAIEFDGSGSNDLDGSISSYQWEFGDGATRKGRKVTYTYSAAGSYTVTLTVTDNAGTPNSDTTPANIGGSSAPPIANAGGPYVAEVDTPVQFDAGLSTDPDGSIDSYRWNFGDNTTGKGERPKHTYTSSRQFTATVTVTDNSGESDSASSNVDIRLGGKPPDADVGGPYAGVVGEPVQFEGGGSSNAVSWSWDFGDGTTGKGKRPTHTYETAGVDGIAFPTVTLTVRSENGQGDSESTVVVVTRP